MSSQSLACSTRSALSYPFISVFSALWHFLSLVWWPFGKIVSLLWIPLSFVIIPLWNFLYRLFIGPLLTILGGLFLSFGFIFIGLLLLAVVSQVRELSARPRSFVSRVIVALCCVAYVGSHIAPSLANKVQPPKVVGFLPRIAAKIAVPLEDWCFQAREVLAGDMSRAVLPSFLHVNVLHLLFNLIGFIPLASRLEHTFGSVKFSCIMVVLSSVPLLLYASVALIAKHVLCVHTLMDQRVVGLSGVVFGLQSVVTVMDSGFQGVPISSAVGVIVSETLRTQNENPQASFMGHACGAAVGVMLGILVGSRVEA